MPSTRAVHFRLYLKDYERLLKEANKEHMPVGTYVRKIIERTINK